MFKLIYHWLLRKCVDPEVPLSSEDLKSSIDDAYESLNRDSGTSIGVVLMFPTIIVAGVGFTYWHRHGQPLWLFWLVGIACFVTLIVTATVAPIPFIKKRVRRNIRAQGIEVCMRCGYWLRGLDSSIDRCPECGWGREAEA